MDLNSSTALPNIESPIADGPLLWAICQTGLSICTLVNIYILISLILFYRREFLSRQQKPIRLNVLHGRSRAQSRRGSLIEEESQPPRSQLQEAAAIPSTSPSRNRKFKVLMLRIAIASSAIVLLKYLIDQLKFFYTWSAHSDLACEVVNDVTEVVLYGFAIVSVYAFLWLRQWMFYHSPAVRGLLYRRELVTFSRWLPVVIVVLSSILAIFHILPIRYRARKGIDNIGCLAVYDLSDPNQAWSILLYIFISSTFQLALLGLFVYPFLQRKLDGFKTKKWTENHFPPTHHHENSASASIYDGSRQNSPSPLLKRSAAYFNDEIMHSARFSTDSLNNVRSLHSTNHLNTLNLNHLDGTEIVANPLHASNTKLQIPEQTCVQPNDSDVRKTWRMKLCNTRCVQEGQPRTNKSTKVDQRQSRVFRSIRRVILWCLLCISSDATTVAVALYFGRGTPLVLVTCLNNFNIIINQLCVVATYSRWREILFPACWKWVHRRKSGPRSKSDALATQSCNNLRLRRNTVISRLDVSTTDYHTTNLSKSRSCSKKSLLNVFDRFSPSLWKKQQLSTSTPNSPSPPSTRNDSHRSKRASL